MDQARFIIQKDETLKAWNVFIETENDIIIQVGYGFKYMEDAITMIESIKEGEIYYEDAKKTTGRAG